MYKVYVMLFNKKYNNIYLVSSIIFGALLFMSVSGYFVINNLENESSVDIFIDKQVDECYEKLKLEKK